MRGQFDVVFVRRRGGPNRHGKPDITVESWLRLSGYGDSAGDVPAVRVEAKFVSIERALGFVAASDRERYLATRLTR